MYPEIERGPQYRPMTAISHGVMDDAAMDDDIALQEAEEWAKDHPLSRTAPGFDNLGFQQVSNLIVIIFLGGNIFIPTFSHCCVRIYNFI